MEASKQRTEHTLIVEGPAPFLDVAFEVIEAHVDRTGEEYEEIITGVDAIDAGDVDQEKDAVLHLYVEGSVDRDEAREFVGLALDRIADKHDMVLARQGVQVAFENQAGEEA